jgi:peptide methionine sulfoxide reductase msrA/msrB
MIAYPKSLAAGLSLLLVAGTVMFLRAEPPKNAAPKTAKKMTTPSTSATPAPEKKYTVPTDEELKQKLTPLQYHVVRENGTERPGTNEYWRTMDEGIYVSIVTGEPLFSSKDKFESDCGWPAFSKPISDSEIKELTDRTAFMVRTEVRTKLGDTHLGHVFEEPSAPGGRRYCINSAAIRFIPKEKMAEAGYGDLLKQFETAKSDAPKK